MALKDITTIEETEQLSADATFYTADGGAFRRAGMDAVKDALGLALESTATKEALLNCFRHVAWIDENGQDYYDALYDALYNIPVSISATFVQGSNVIYNTDPLSVLRQYLVVRATYEDETVQTVTAYTLSGTLTVGTSTITVAYKGRTASFEVTVTEDPRHITAVFTQGSSVFFTDDSLDMLKANLVVTYYDSAEATGVVLSDSDYMLAGGLVPGTSTVQVVYGGFTTTFTVTTLENIAIPLSEWNLVSSDYDSASYVDGVLRVLCSNTADYNNWNVWVANTKPTLWANVLGKTLHYRATVRAESRTDSGGLNLYPTIFAHADITSMSATNRKSAGATAINPSNTDLYTVSRSVVADVANFATGSMTITDAATTGMLFFSRSYDVFYIVEAKMGVST